MSSDKRPSTALHRVIEKVVSISGFGVSTNSQSQPIDPTLTEDNSNKLSKITSSTIHQKFSKLIKFNNKSRNLEKKLINDIYSWVDTIPNQECSQIIKDFNHVFGLQSVNNTELNERLDKIKISLNSVNEREKKQKILLAAKFKTEKLLKENQSKYGPKASSTTLTNEKLENIECSLQVIEQQFLRSISTDLKETLIDYIIALHKTSRKLQDYTDELIQHLNNIEDNNGGSPIENEIARISPNKYSRYNNSNGNGLKRKIPNFYEDDQNSKQQPIKLKNYDLPTPQSTCAECKKTPCIHTYQTQPDLSIQPLRTHAQQQQQQALQQVQPQPLPNMPPPKSHAQSRDNFGFHDNNNYHDHEPIRAPSMYSDHWN
ncbi:hypothetical protein KGF54_002819 [Candida jiufengensis]|uniref:uncharacterized protein n=1 Tax=Candida jiufengensis TaxID=497108 RepID=UPI0022247414|nr:uncharacterized protein KGF54_002819 [Candida jiufengensis]KAI5953447.1 hypothetical protein KGF54_002819 [Candida jiufengensis]